LSYIVSISTFEKNILMDFVRNAYKIEPLNKLLMDQTLVIPDYKESLPFCLVSVKPPPKYNYICGTYGCSTNNEPTLWRRAKRRITSFGEFGKGKGRSRKKPTNVTAIINDNNEEVKTDKDQLDLTSFIPRLASKMEVQKANEDAIKALMSDVVAPASFKKCTCTVCGICTKTGHLTKKCPLLCEGVELLVGGQYLIGTNPSGILDKGRIIYLEYGR
jgi:hypothetical protein